MNTTKGSPLGTSKESLHGTNRKSETGVCGLFTPKSITTRGDKNGLFKKVHDLGLPLISINQVQLNETHQ